MPLFCTQCGAKVPATSSKFCTGCGATLPVSGAPAAPQQAAPQPPPPQYPPPQQYAPLGYPPPAYPQYPPPPQYPPYGQQYAPPPAPEPYEPPKPFVVDTTVKYMVPDALKGGSPLDAVGNLVKGATGAPAPAGEPAAAPSGGLSSLLGGVAGVAGVGSVLAMAGAAAKNLFGGAGNAAAPTAPPQPQQGQSMWGDPTPAAPSQPLPPVPPSQPAAGGSMWDAVGAAPAAPAPAKSVWDAAPAQAPVAPAPQGQSMWDAVGTAPTAPVAPAPAPAPQGQSMWDAVGAAPAQAPVAPAPQPAAGGSMWDAIGTTPAPAAQPAQPAPASGGSMWDAIGAPADPPKSTKAKASRSVMGAEQSEPSSGGGPDLMSLIGGAIGAPAGANGSPDLMSMLGGAVATFAPMLEQAASAAGYKEVAAGIHQISEMFTTITHPRGHEVVIGGHKEATDDPTDVHYDAHKGVDPGGLPRHVDLRPGMSTVEDQGQIGSCTANAIAGAYEFLERKQTGRYTDVSRLFIYYLERQFEHSIGEDSGAELRDGMKALQQYGVCSEKVWPYNPTHFKNKPPDSAFAEAKNHTISEYRRVPIELDAIRHCLAEGFPMCFGATIYKSFEAEGHHGMISMPKSREQDLGGHAMLLVGYDDEKQLFIVRNSWGTDWGDGGYCYFPYAYLTDADLCSDIWTVRKGDNLQFGQ